VRLAASVALALGALAAAGCGSGTGGVVSGGDASRGKELFIKGESGKPSCATCHTLKDAVAAGAPAGKVGPDLDAAFSSDKAQGFKESTIRQVVADQIKFAGQYGTQGPTMPQHLVTGDGVDDVAAYVASVAGRPVAGGGGGGGQAAPGTTQQTTTGQTTTQASGGGSAANAASRSLFKTNCGSCHTLADAGTTGTVGPNLDDLKPDEATVRRQDRNGGGGMPAFKGILSTQQINALAKYIASVAGK
jgi:mono/diheme cytochrome c family protein